MNDDFFFNQSVTIDDFLDDKSIVIHGHWNRNTLMDTKLKSRQLSQKLFGTMIQPRHTMAQMLSGKILGMKRFFKIQHYPHIVDKNILKNYLLNHPQLLETQIKFKFRDIEQVNSITLMNHLKIQKNEVRLKSDVAINYIEDENNIDSFISNLENESIKYGCIQSLDQLDTQAYQRISQAMVEKFKTYLPSSITTG